MRLTERFLASDPPTDEQWRSALAFTRELLAAEVPDSLAGAVGGGIGVAGTVTTLVAHKLGMREYDAAQVHGHLLSQADIEAAARTFRGLAAAERARLPGIQRGREDVILAGALIAGEVCRRFGLAGLTVSEADILEGCALFLAEEAERRDVGGRRRRDDGAARRARLKNHQRSRRRRSKFAEELALGARGALLPNSWHRSYCRGGRLAGAAGTGRSASLWKR